MTMPPTTQTGHPPYLDEPKLTKQPRKEARMIKLSLLKLIPRLPKKRALCKEVFNSPLLFRDLQFRLELIRI